MTNIKRWGQTWDGIFPQDDGDFVEFEEYQKLIAQRDELLAALKELISRGEFYSSLIELPRDLSGADLYYKYKNLIAKCEAQS